jgi:hypothetical protein
LRGLTIVRVQADPDFGFFKIFTKGRGDNTPEVVKTIPANQHFGTIWSKEMEQTPFTGIQRQKIKQFRAFSST